MDLALDFTTDGNASEFIRDGWSGPETVGTWSLGTESSLEIPLRPEVPYCLTLQVVGCHMPNRTDPQPLEIFLNEGRVASIEVRGLELFRIRLPAQGQSQSSSRIRFCHPDFRNPRDYGLDDDRPLAILFKSLRFQPWAEELRQETARQARPQVLVIGQSHLGAVEQAVVLREERGQSRFWLHFLSVTHWDHWVTWHDGFKYDPALLAKIAEHLLAHKCAAVISMLGGNEYYVHGAINHARKFDFVLPDRSDLPPTADAELVTFDVICDRARYDIECVLGLLREIGEAKLPLFHIAAPAPTADNERVLRNLMRGVAPDQRDKMQDEIGAFGAASPELRLKLWLVYRLVTQQVCRDYGIDFVDVPASSIGERGFILDRLTADSLHGTTDYGELIVAELERRLDQTIAESTHSHGLASLS